MPELTGGQVLARGSRELAPILRKSHATYRKIRTHPAVSLARALSTAPIVAGDWSVGSKDTASDEAISFVQDTMIPLREPLIETALYGGIDFGHQGFEKIFELDLEGRVTVRLKPLLHDFTEILVVEATGAFDGFKQEETIVPLDASFNIPFRMEGTNHYGQSLLDNALSTYNEWAITNAGAMRYDEKIAGTFIVLKYPYGETPDETGKMVPNAELAATILDVVLSSGAIAIPKMLDKFKTSLNADPSMSQWELDFESDGVPRQYSFVNRLEHLEKQLIRSLLVPERTVIEAKFGSQADAGVHSDLALTHMTVQHRHITRFVNWYVVDQLLELNFGPEARGTVFLEAAPLEDTKKETLKEVYLALLSNQFTAIELMRHIDFDTVMDQLGISKAEETISVEDDPSNPSNPEISDDGSTTEGVSSSTDES